MYENRCPSCNRELELDIVGSNVQVLCKCGVSGPDFDDSSSWCDNAPKAIAAWNYLFPNNAYTKLTFIPPTIASIIVDEFDDDVYETINKLQCQHKWKHYQGLVETYEYCELCNEKRK